MCNCKKSMSKSQLCIAWCNRNFRTTAEEGRKPKDVDFFKVGSYHFLNGMRKILFVNKILSRFKSHQIMK